jgi:tetratricopeptide (TPR) repeat protein
MSREFNFLLNQALQYIRNGNLDTAQLLLTQITKIEANHSEALRLLSVIATLQDKNELALEIIQKSIISNRRNGVAYSIQGNIQLRLGMVSEGVASFKTAIKLTPGYAEAYSNLGNVYQELNDIDKAIDLHKKAISIDPYNPEFFCNLGNSYWSLDQIQEAKKSYESSIALDSGHVNSQYNLAHINLREFNFPEGWSQYEARWFTANHQKSIAINSSRPLWDGQPRNNSLFIWAEQGIGDQILYSSMLRDLDQYPQKKIVSVDKKLIPIFQRSYPNIRIVDKDIRVPEQDYDEHIPMASLGKFFRSDINSFKNVQYPYLFVKSQGFNFPLSGKINCGLSWKSGRAKFGAAKSIPLDQLDQLFSIKNINFVNLQYGDVRDEISFIASKLGAGLQVVKEIDLYDNIDDALSLLNACNLIITTSNTTAHLAGAIGKETLLILPCGNSRFWYWQDIHGTSLWYPSIKVFKQDRLGDWEKPIQLVKEYLENRFEI